MGVVHSPGHNIESKEQSTTDEKGTSNMRIENGVYAQPDASRSLQLSHQQRDHFLLRNPVNAARRGSITNDSPSPPPSV